MSVQPLHVVRGTTGVPIRFAHDLSREFSISNLTIHSRIGSTVTLET